MQLSGPAPVIINFTVHVRQQRTPDVADAVGSELGAALTINVPEAADFLVPVVQVRERTLHRLQHGGRGGELPVEVRRPGPGILGLEPDVVLDLAPGVGEDRADLAFEEVAALGWISGLKACWYSLTASFWMVRRIRCRLE